MGASVKVIANLWSLFFIVFSNSALMWMSLDDGSGSNPTWNGVSKDDPDVGFKIIAYVLSVYLGVGHGGIYPRNNFGNIILCIILICRWLIIYGVIHDVIYSFLDGLPESIKAARLMNNKLKHIAQLQDYVDQQANKHALSKGELKEPLSSTTNVSDIFNI